LTLASRRIDRHPHAFARGSAVRIRRLANRPYGSRLGHGSDKPVPLVMAAQELLLLGAISDEEKQVSVGGLNVKDGNVRVRF